MYYSKALEKIDMRSRPVFGVRYYVGMGLYHGLNTIKYGSDVVKTLTKYLTQQNLYKENKNSK